MTQRYRCEAVEADGRRGASHVGTTQAHPAWYVEEVERERPRWPSGAAARQVSLGSL